MEVDPIGANLLSPSERVFPTQAGGPLNPSNVRNRTLALAVERANERLEALGSVPLPDGLTPHKLRHTFASLLVALGTDPGAVMDQLGARGRGVHAARLPTRDAPRSALEASARAVLVGLATSDDDVSAARASHVHD
jgi:integrase